MGRELGRILIAVGGLLLVVGLLAYAGGLSWFGRLPGDIRLEGPSTRLYVPWVSMLLVSVAVSLIAALVRRFF